ncbi:hypothetical protein [Salinilacihabitans rarus]|uniref:hypothetical protein n=1 Tax=Salinilacihabitans rarus TaxID=2961596 RepID=UPI0020C8DA02|nr:hypothetical protein [Salinilacihabitans rarus]
MSEISPEELDERVRAGGDDPLALDARHEAEYDDRQSPDSLNVDGDDELTGREPGPNNCAAE